MAIGFRTLVRQLDVIHKRHVMKLAVLRSAWMGLVALLVLILADLMFAFGESPRVALDALGIIGCVCVAIVTYWMLRRSSSRERMVARVVEEHCPEFGNVLVNAIDFEGDIERGSRETLSRDLMHEEITTASERILTLADHRSLRPDTFKKEVAILLAAGVALFAVAVLAPRVFFTVLPRLALPYADFPPYSATHIAVDPGGAVIDYGESLRVAAQMTGPMPTDVSLVIRRPNGENVGESPMFDAGDGLFFQTIESIQDDIEYFVEIPRGRSKRFRISVTKIPRIDGTTVTYVYPAYTRRPTETRVFSGEPIKGYAKTEVTLAVTSNRELREGRLIINGNEYVLVANEAHGVAGSFSLTEPGDFTLSIVDVDGNSSKEPLAGRVEILEDQKPEVTIAAPGMDSFSVPDADVPIMIEATDDLGLTNISIYRSHNGSADSRKAVYAGDGADNILSVTEKLNLKDLGVRPGDVIDYYVTATDSRPDAPQTASTESFRLQIISMDDYRSFAQSQMTATDLKEKYDAYLEEMEKLAATQEELERTTEALRAKLNESGEESLTAEETQQLQETAEQQQKLAESAQSLQENLEKEADTPVIFDVEKGYKDALKEFAQRVAAAKDHMGEAGQKMSDASSNAQSSGNPKDSLAKASEEQKAALEQLRENVKDYKDAIQKPNENLEKVASLMADVEMFKYLYSLQKGLERQTRYYQNKTSPSLDDQVRLKELSDQQEAVKQELTALREALNLHADELEKLDQHTEGAELPDAAPPQVEKDEHAPSNN